MELHNQFDVPVPIEEAWAVMLDVAQLAPCMPGATVDSIQGDEVLGHVKVKLGPVNITYGGRLTFLEKDADQHRVVMNAAARETRGNGTASARITAVMEAVSDSTTRVEVVTDLNITGKPAQFGRTMMGDVSARIVDEFAANLAHQLATRSADGTNGAGETRVSGTAKDPRASAGALDLVGAAGGPVLKRLAPALALVAGVLLAVLLARRPRRSRRAPQ